MVFTPRLLPLYQIFRRRTSPSSGLTAVQLESH